MSCGLEDYELYILEELFDRRCFNSDHSFNLKRIYKGYKRRFKEEMVDVAKELSKKGYITKKGKAIQNIIFLIVIWFRKPFVHITMMLF